MYKNLVILKKLWSTLAIENPKMYMFLVILIF
jgi:hypothetical protein